MNFKKFKIWLVTDGSEGMLTQVRGLADQFSSNIKEIKADLIFPWNKLQPGFLPVFKWIFKNQILKDDLPDMIISCGRKSVYLSLYLKKKYKKIINIHIQNPKISSKKFNFIVSPNHDNQKGSNIINSVGALHYFKKSINFSNKNLLTCIIGGDNQHYYFNNNEAIKLSNKLLEIKKQNLELEILVITSRRTSKKIKDILLDKLSDIASIWTGNGENPYKYSISNSKYFIVTSDSTSMISEAAISGRPIYVYHLPFKRKSKRISSFHKEFVKLGITRELENIEGLENWLYDPLNESKRIGSIIKKRIIEENI